MAAYVRGRMPFPPRWGRIGSCAGNSITRLPFPDSSILQRAAVVPSFGFSVLPRSFLTSTHHGVAAAPPASWIGRHRPHSASLFGNPSNTWNPMNSASPLWRGMAPPGLSSTTICRHKHTIKTNKSVSKRFRARGDGTLVRMKSGKSHNTGDKPRARKNRLGQSTTVSEPKVEKKIKRVLPQ